MNLLKKYFIYSSHSSRLTACSLIDPAASHSEPKRLLYSVGWCENTKSKVKTPQDPSLKRDLEWKSEKQNHALDILLVDAQFCILVSGQNVLTASVPPLNHFYIDLLNFKPRVYYFFLTHFTSTTVVKIYFIPRRSKIYHANFWV